MASNLFPPADLRPARTARPGQQRTRPTAAARTVAAPSSPPRGALSEQLASVPRTSEPAGFPRVTSTPPCRTAARVRPPLWLHLHLPRLALEVHTRGDEGGRACVLVEPGTRRPQVLLANRRAATLGIRPGMPLAAAHALGDLSVLERDERAEQRMLARLCRWALQFTAELSAVAPDGLVLEVGGSLKLFDGLEGLLRQLRGGLRRLGFRVDYAVAPTPLAAALLADR
ncbi:MAG: hypothetical protein RLW62_17780, partial [Gammaproteobacteria bacterium]